LRGDPLRKSVNSVQGDRAHAQETKTTDSLRAGRRTLGKARTDEVAPLRARDALRSRQPGDPSAISLLGTILTNLF